MSVDYWLGVATLPVLAALGYGGLFGYVWIEIQAERKLGVTWGLKMRRGVDGISNYILRNNIWWERSWGPVFAGCWYREVQGRRATRWVGFGSVSGPCFMVFRSEELSNE